jgi:hypothetical protein
MKSVVILTVLSALCCSSLAKRNPADLDYEYAADSWFDMHQETDDQSMNNLAFSGKAETSETNFAEVMGEVNEKLDAAVVQAMSNLNSVLMLKDSSKVSAELRSKIADFKKAVVKHFESDLAQVTAEFKDARGVEGPLSDEEKYEFTDRLKSKWEQTLTDELDAFQKNILPPWVSAVRNTWKGIEKKVMQKIQKFKKFVHKTIPRYSDTCALPSSVLVGSNTIAAASRNMKRGSMQRMDKDSGLSFGGKVALFILAVIGVIVLAAGAPFFFVFLGVMWMTDKITEMIFGPIPDFPDGPVTDKPENTW